MAVITGAGRGLGREYARLLASRGARVVVNDPGPSVKGEGFDRGPANAVVEEIAAAGGEAVACTESVATVEGAAAIVRAALERFGRLDVLIHNAGNVRYGSLEEITYEDFKAVVDVHLMGAFHVVNYGVSKAGIIGLNNVAAIEGAQRGVKSNIILPGAVTRMAEGLDVSHYPPMGPELVAPVVGWLAHESCSISGEMISMAGRVAKAFIAESAGVYRPTWSIDEVAQEIDAIRDTVGSWTIPTLPCGYLEHLKRSFEMARSGIAARQDHPKSEV